MRAVLWVLSGLCVVALAAAMPVEAFADHLSGGNGWSVTYTSGGALDDNFSAREYADQVGNLQPGDDIELVVTLRHDNDTPGDWYMANEVVKSLEDGAASGSAYSYRLTYTGPGGAETVLYDSDSVGGEGSRGLADATSALDDFFFLENLSKGQSATVRLFVGLDGETEGNAYFNTLAQLKMSFAVQPDTQATSGGSSGNPGTSGSTPNRTVVRTGDETNLFPFYLAMVASGLVLAGLGVASVRLRRAEEREGGVR